MAKTQVPYDSETIERLRRLVKGCGTWLEARDLLVKDLGIHPDNATRLNRRQGIWSGNSRPVTAAKTESRDNVEVKVEGARTLEEAVALCDIDLAKWEPKGFSVRSGRTGMGWNARFALKDNPINVEELAAEFIARVGRAAPRFDSVKKAKTAPEGRLLELSIPDLHLAKLCWQQETGHKDYDIRIAVRLYHEAVRGLLQSARGMGISRILLPVGNDLMNSDNAAGTTTAGTPQAASEDSRWKKTFMTACELITDTVEELAREFPVDVVIVAGNHDEERCFYLGQYVKGWFRNHPNVTVDNAATQRKYYRFGSTLIGYTHGDGESSARLPLIMAQERKEEWSQTQHHEWHCGHFHKLMVSEDIGCKVRWLPSLCPPDEWHSSKGFIGNDQAAEAFVYDQTAGLIASLYFRA